MKRIVIVDDQYTTRLILSEVVQSIDINDQIEVASFSSVNETFDWLKTNEADLFLIDYMMDDINGYELFKKLKDNPNYSNTPIIGMSADDDVSVKYQFLEEGAADFLVKPIDYHECKLKCKNLLVM